MAVANLNLDRIHTTTGALDRIPQGTAALELAKRLGLLTPAHLYPEGREPFPRRVSDLSNDEISDLHAYWLSEAGRLTELVGQINGVKQLMDTQLKAARAGARSRARQNLPEGAKKPTQAELNDLAEEDQAVIDLIGQAAYIDLLQAHAKAALDATKMYLDGLNREVILRTSQMKARILG